jgi:hypothetical protein
MRLWIRLKNKPEATRMNRKHQIELEQETDGRWIAENWGIIKNYGLR